MSKWKWSMRNRDDVWLDVVEMFGGIVEVIVSMWDFVLLWNFSEMKDSFMGLKRMMENERVMMIGMVRSMEY